MVPVGGPAAGSGGPGGSGCALALLDVEGLSGVSGMNAPGSGCSVSSWENALVGVRLAKTPRMLGAGYLLVVRRSDRWSVCEVCGAAAFAAAHPSSRRASYSISFSGLRS